MRDVTRRNSTAAGTNGSRNFIRRSSAKVLAGVVCAMALLLGSGEAWAQPANDEPAGAEVISGSGPFPVLSSVVASNLTATASIGDPLNSCQVDIDRSLWYRFTPAVSATYRISTAQEDGCVTTVSDTVLGIYTSTGGAAGPFTQVTCDDDGATTLNFQSVMSVALTSGTEYWIVVFEYSGGSLPGGSVQIAINGVFPPANDTVAGAVPLFLDSPTNGFLNAATTNDYILAGTSAYIGIGHSTPMTAPGPDVVYSFTAPFAAEFNVRVFGGSANLVIYAATALPSGPAPQTATSTLLAANRNANTTLGGEELIGLTLTASQTVFVVVDLSAAGSSNFTIEVTHTIRESEPNDTPQTAATPINGVTGSTPGTTDVDFYSLGTPIAGSRVYAMIEAIGGNSADYAMRVTTNDDVIEFDDDDGDAAFGSSGFGPVIAGTQVTGSAAYLRVSRSSATEPYHLYYVVQAPTSVATTEVEPNDTTTTAIPATGNLYFYGRLGTTNPSLDSDVFAFDGVAGELVFVGLDCNVDRIANTSFDGRLQLLDPLGASLITVNGATTASDIVSGTRTLTAINPTAAGEGLLFRLRTSGTHFVRVFSTSTFNPSAGLGADYVLSIQKASPPELRINGGTLTTFQTGALNSPSTEQSYAIAGFELTTDITITAPAQFQVSTTSGSNFSGSLTLTQTGGNVPSTTIFVRYNPSAAPGPHTGSITHTSAGATQRDIVVTGNLILTPTIATSVGTLATLIATGTATPSNILSYNVQGTALTNDIDVSAPTNFEVATSVGGPFSASLSLTQSGGNLNQDVFVRFQAPSAGTFTGSISHTSTGAAGQNVAVSGEVRFISTFPASIPTPILFSFTLPPSTSTLFCSATGGIRAVRVVGVNIQHNWVEDVELFLISPSGTRVELTTDNGGSLDHYQVTTFDDAASTAITAGTPPFNGTFRPEGSLAVLVGESPFGTWTLEATDDDAGIDGTIVAWSLEVETDSPTVPVAVMEVTEDPTAIAVANGSAPSAGRNFGAVLVGNTSVVKDVRVKNTGTGDLILTSISSSSSEFIVDPNGPLPRTIAPNNSSTFKVAFEPVTAIAGPQTTSINIAHNASFTATPFVVNFRGDTLTQPPSSAQIAAIRLPGIIFDASPAGVSTVAFCDLAGTVLSVSVTGIDIGHPLADDLILRLTSPNGTAVTLVAVDNSLTLNSNFTGTSFDDAAGTAITSSAPPYSGTFRPVQSLSAFAGVSARGLWTLSAVDAFADFMGEIRSWTLNITATDAGTDAPLLTVRESSPTGTAIPSDQTVGGLRNFGPMDLLGGRAVTTTVVIVNDGTSPMTLGAPSVLGSADFTVVAPATFTSQALAAGASVALDLNFDPSALGAVTATVQFTHDGFGGTSTFNLNVAGEGVTTLGVTTTSLDVPKALVEFPVTSPVDAFIVCNRTGTINDINVNVSVTHTFVSDLRLSLEGPDGTIVVLSNQRGGTFANYTNTTFDDQSATSITTAAAPFTGTFRPETPLTAFSGKNVHGVWRLRGEDQFAEDVGTIQAFSLAIDVIPLGTPGIQVRDTSVLGSIVANNDPASGGRAFSTLVPGGTATATVVVRSTGSTFLNVSNLVVGAGSAPDFTIIDAAAFTASPIVNATNRSFQVLFTATGTAGLRNGFVTFDHNAGGTTQTFRVNFTGGVASSIPPTIALITPSTAPSGGGASVTVTGTELIGASLTFGGAAATNVNVTSATQLTCTIPAGTPGAANVVITTPAGTTSSAALFSYQGPRTTTFTGDISSASSPLFLRPVIPTTLGTVTTVTPRTGTPAHRFGVQPFVVRPGAGGTYTITGTWNGFDGVILVYTPSFDANSPVTNFLFGNDDGSNGAGSSEATFTLVGGQTYVIVPCAFFTASGGTYVLTVTGPDTVAIPPTVTVLNPNSGLSTGGTAVTISGGGFTGATGVTFRGVAATNLQVVNDSTITCNAPANATGTASVIVTTPLGSNGANTAFLYVDATGNAPTVVSVFPASGSTLGGLANTAVTGTDFVVGSTSVRFGANFATNVVVQSPTTLICTTPSGPAGVTDVAVVTALGTGIGVGAYTYIAPTVYSDNTTGRTTWIRPNAGNPPVAPVSGTTAPFHVQEIDVPLGGTGSYTITAAWSGFDGFLVLYQTSFNPTSQLTNVLSANDDFGGAAGSQIVANLTQGTRYFVVATAFFGGGAGPFTVTIDGPSTVTLIPPPPPPTIISVTPNSGLTGGTANTPVTIVGTNFAAGAQVSFGGIAATNVSVTSATTLTCIAPNSITVQQVAVIVTTISGATTQTALYDYVASTGVPTVTTISPNSGTTAGGTVVTINGTNLTGTTSVTIGGAAATPFVVASNTTITATTPVGTAGPVNVVVTTPSGTGTGTNLFTYVAPVPVLEIRQGSGSGATLTAGAAPSGGFAFGDRAFNPGTPVTTTIFIRNSGAAVLNLSSLGLTGNTTVFAINPTSFASGTLAVGASTTIDVTFNPAAAALGSVNTTLQATVTFAHTDTTNTSPFTVLVSGRPTAGVITVTDGATTLTSGGTVNLGSQAVTGGPTAARVITVQNTGLAPATVLTFAATGDVTEFGVTTSTALPATLAAGQTYTISVTFDPSTAATRAVVIELTHDGLSTGAATPFTLNIAGTGINSIVTNPGGSGSSGGGGGGGCSAGGQVDTSTPVLLGALLTLWAASRARRRKVAEARA